MSHQHPSVPCVFKGHVQVYSDGDENTKLEFMSLTAFGILENTVESHLSAWLPEFSKGI
jgi:hypothetical protein